jgi:hypothetical protein
MDPADHSDADTPRDTELRERGWRDQDVILLASGDTITLSILALRYRFDTNQEAASIISIIIMIMTVGLASLMRAFGLRLGVRHNLSIRVVE